MANTNIALGITARTAGFTQAMRKAASSVSLLRSGVTSLTGSILKWGAALSPAALGGGLALITKRSFDAIDSTAKLADKIDIATESLIGFKRAADLAGAGGSIDKGLINLQKSVADAAIGLETQARAFGALGISAQELINLPIEEQMYRVADSISKVGNATDRTRIATQIFGRAGADLIPLLRGGSDALRQSVVEAQSLGIAFSRIDAAKVEEANDSFADLTSTLSGIGNAIAINVAPYITAITTGMKDFIKESGGLGTITNKALGVTVNIVGVLADGFNLLKGAVDVARGAIGLLIGKATHDLGNFIVRIDNLTGALPLSVVNAAKEASIIGLDIVKSSAEAFNSGLDSIDAAFKNSASQRLRVTLDGIQNEANARAKEFAANIDVGLNADPSRLVKTGTSLFGKLFDSLAKPLGSFFDKATKPSGARTITPDYGAPSLALAGSVEDYQARNAARMQDRQQQIAIKQLDEQKKQTKALEDIKRTFGGLFERVKAVAL